MTDGPTYQQCSSAKTVLRAFESVECVDILDPDQRLGLRAVEFTVSNTDRVPPQVLRQLPKYDLGIRDVSSQGDYLIVIAT